MQGTFFIHKGVGGLFKLIAIDLDGTLLNKDRKISKENKDIINRIIELGYEVVIATGRRYYSAKQMVKELDNHLIILANNGNIVRRSFDDELVFAKFLDHEAYKDIILEGKKFGLHGIVHVDLYHEGVDMVVEMDEVNNSHMMYLSEPDKRYLVIPEKEIMEQERVLAVVYAGGSTVLNQFYNDINLKYPNRYNSHVLEKIYIAEAMYEAMNPLGSKWKSLLEYATQSGIKKEEIIAIGDDNNDLEMILNAGLGIAMKNSSELVKKAAKIITQEDNNNSGVAIVLEKVLNL